MLKQRIITAIILIIFAIAGIFYLPSLWFSIAASLIIALGAWEFSGFFWRKDLFKRVTFVLLFLLLAWVLEFVTPIFALWLGLVWWVVVPYLLIYYVRYERSLLNNVIQQLVAGMMIFVPCLIALLEIREVFGPEYLLYVLLVVWAADVGAYFAGRFWGAHKLAEAISPKKTVEGFIGGTVLSLVVGIGGAFILRLHGVQWLTVLTLVVVVSLWSVVGDLFESMLKRQVGVKDSGVWLPGHGGVYDRIDSLTAALPMFAFGMLLFR